MPTRAEVESLRTANSQLTRLVNNELDDLLGDIIDLSPESARDALLDVVPAVVDEYGDVSATISAEWYENIYGGRVELGKTIDRRTVQEGVRYSAGHLWTSAPSAIGGSLLNQVDKWVSQPGRDTIARTAERNNMRWARVPSGGKTCSFCLVLASRDAVYFTEQTALRRETDGETYHGNCRCVAVPMESPDDYPEGYNPDALYGIYRAARESANSGFLPDITAAIRRDRPDLVTDAVTD